MIWLYRLTLGQLVGGQCRFYPSCSSYSETAIRELGWFRGLALGIWRIARCNPFSPGGVDHPPRREPQPYDVVNGREYDAVTLSDRGSPPGDGVEGLTAGPPSPPVSAR
ncbi:MAG: membrane protein insertion efficiency factor YidD [Actinomycetota bacterium]|nr:membrane protein insertion efficiency factor YidD [Actinomycetota bacterium]